MAESLPVFSDQEEGQQTSGPINKEKDYPLAPGETKVICPYNKAHNIRQSKMGNHLARCRDNYEDICMAIGEPLVRVKCCWNRAHICLDKELSYHLEQCSDNPQNMDKSSLGKSPDEWKKFIPTDRPQPEMPKMDPNDDWDKDDEFKYDPSKKIQDDCLLYMPSGMSRAKRNLWRKSTHEKFLRQAAGPVGLTTAASSSSTGQPRSPVQEVKFEEDGLMMTSSFPDFFLDGDDDDDNDQDKEN